MWCVDVFMNVLMSDVFMTVWFGTCWCVDDNYDCVSNYVEVSIRWCVDELMCHVRCWCVFWWLRGCVVAMMNCCVDALMCWWVCWCVDVRALAIKLMRWCVSDLVLMRYRVLQKSGPVWNTGSSLQTCSKPAENLVSREKPAKMSSKPGFCQTWFMRVWTKVANLVYRQKPAKNLL
jgi:hypothetical protein